MSKSKEESLWRACTHGDLEIVRKLADDPAVDVNWVGFDRGDTPLHRACRFGWLEIMKVLLAHPKFDLTKRNKGRGTPFDLACYSGQREVVSLLLADPRIDPNEADDEGYTPLFMACQEGRKEVVLLLLADPRVDPSKPLKSQTTPFFIACENGHKEVVSLMLADPRIDPDKPMNNQTTPLWFASQNGHLVVAQHLLASAKEIDTKRRSHFKNRTAAEQGRAMGERTKGTNDTDEDHQRKKANGPFCASLIDEYEHDPVAVRHRLCRLPGLREYFIGHLFALVVFHSDSFVVINERLAHPDTKRFFKITSQLPLDLQMVLCNRIFGSPRDIILSRDSEPGFHLLTRTTTWQQ